MSELVWCLVPSFALRIISISQAESDDMMSPKLNASEFYDEYHGHKVSHLNIALEFLRPSPGE